MTRRWVWVLAALVVLGLLVWQSHPWGDSPPPTRTVAGSTPGPSGGPAPGSTDPASGLPVVAQTDLPAEARDTLALIDAGGPFPYDEDGSVFGNRESLLPSQPSGYYHEYTVETPGSEDRGARRIVVGAAGEYFWTSDHYQSFERIAR